MDLTLDVEEYKLNIRAAGVIIHNNKILTHKNINKDHYCLPGGRVEIGESSKETIKREIKEELGKDMEYIWLHEVGSKAEESYFGPAETKEGLEEM